MSTRLVSDSGAEVAAHVEIADNPWSRFVGLMGRKQLPAGEALWIEPCNSVHMFFMRFAIDAVFLDREGRVLKVYPSLRPWRMTSLVRGGRVCVELPAGSCAGLGVATGQVLRLA